MMLAELEDVFAAIGRERTRRLCGAHVFKQDTTGLTGTTYRCKKCPLGISEGALLGMQEDALELLAPCPSTREHVRLANSIMGHTLDWRQTALREAE